MLRTLFSFNPGRFLDNRAERRREIKRNLRRAVETYMFEIRPQLPHACMPRSFKTARKQFCRLLAFKSNPYYAYHRQALDKL